MKPLGIIYVLALKMILILESQVGSNQMRDL